MAKPQTITIFIATVFLAPLPFFCWGLDMGRITL